VLILPLELGRISLYQNYKVLLSLFAYAHRTALDKNYGVLDFTLTRGCFVVYLYKEIRTFKSSSVKLARQIK